MTSTPTSVIPKAKEILMSNSDQATWFTICPVILVERICDGSGFLGIEPNKKHNAKKTPLISPDAGRVKVRGIRTDEELTMARSVIRVLGPGSVRGN